MTVCSTDTDRMSVIFPSHEMMMLVAVPSSNFFVFYFLIVLSESVLRRDKAKDRSVDRAEKLVHIHSFRPSHYDFDT